MFAEWSGKKWNGWLPPPFKDFQSLISRRKWLYVFRPINFNFFLHFIPPFIHLINALLSFSPSYSTVIISFHSFHWVEGHLSSFSLSPWAALSFLLFNKREKERQRREKRRRERGPQQNSGMKWSSYVGAGLQPIKERKDKPSAEANQPPIKRWPKVMPRLMVVELFAPLACRAALEQLGVALTHSHSFHSFHFHWFHQNKNEIHSSFRSFAHFWLILLQWLVVFVGVLFFRRSQWLRAALNPPKKEANHNQQLPQPPFIVQSKIK